MVNLRSPAVPGVTRPDLRPAGRPLVERIACWSARHRKLVIGAWLLFLGAAILATLPIVDTKTLGVGLAAAVLIDATLVRGILLPAAMTLLGERCWYLPRWLSWLPGRRLPAGSAMPGQAAVGKASPEGVRVG